MITGTHTLTIPEGTPICGDCSNYQRGNAWSGNCMINSAGRSPGMECDIGQYASARPAPPPADEDSYLIQALREGLALKNAAIYLYKQGAEHIASENQRLRAALKPFADIDLTTSKVPEEFGLLVLRARVALESKE